MLSSDQQLGWFGEVCQPSVEEFTSDTFFAFLSSKPLPYKKVLSDSVPFLSLQDLLLPCLIFHTVCETSFFEPPKYL